MRTQFSKIALAAFAVNSALSMAFAGIPANCAEEIITLSKSSDFDMKKFTNNLPNAVAKAKQMAKAPNKPKDSAKTNIGITFGCVIAFPESPVEIAFLLKDISQKTASDAVAAAPAQAQPQYVQPQEQPQYVYPVYPPPQAQPQYIPPQVQPQYAQPQEQPQYVQLQVQPQYQPLQVQCQCQCPQQEQSPSLQSYSPNKVKLRIIQKLIEDDLEKNKVAIQMESVYLSPYEIDALYKKNAKNNAIGWAALGGSLGLGIGSYIQGNIMFGITQTILDVSALFFVSEDDLNPAISYTILAISRIAGLIAPFVYQNSYNKTLEDALNGYGLSYSIDPLIVPKDGGAPAVGLAFNLRY